MSTVKERPILFKGEMVRALLDGSKTQTRRIVKPQPLYLDGGVPYRSLPKSLIGIADPKIGIVHKCPFGIRGDQIWVRETWCSADVLFLGYECDPPQCVGYRADLEARIDGVTPVSTHAWNWDHESVCWKPSIHMPRWASRISLEIESIRVERLQDISEADCWAEGIGECDGLLDDLKIIDIAKRMGRCIEDAVPTYGALWESINGAGSWDANPWVWAITFRRI